MINCIIVDDEQHAIDVLVMHSKETSTLNILETFNSPIKALEYLVDQKVDLVFLDIHMPTMSGLDFINANTSKTNYILTTAYSDYAVKGFELSVVDYLVKPISLDRFIKATQKAAKTIVPFKEDLPRPDLDYIFVKTESKGKLLKININDIDYIEGLKNYVGIYHNGQKTLALLNLKDLEERLPKQQFIRVHKSFIVPLRKIQGIEGNIIKLKSVTAEILLGETYKDAFMKIIGPSLMSR